MSQDEATARALLALDREARRSAECAERVRLVVHALALRYGVNEPGAPTKGHAQERRLDRTTFEG